MSSLNFQEISRKSLITAKNEEILLSWSDQLIAARTEKGINFLEMSCNLNCLDKNIDYFETVVSAPKTSPATNLLTKKIFKGGMKNIDYTEMLIDSSFWPHNDQLLQEMTTIIDFKWSSPINNNAQILATLNNVGNIDFFIAKRHHWENILNLSSILEKRFSSSISNTLLGLHELRKAVYNVETSSICWGPTIDKNSCYFVTCQKNCQVIIWMIQCIGSEVKAEIVGEEIQINSSEIISVVWIEKPDNKFILVCGNAEGQIIGLNCEINNSIKLLNFVFLWEHKDQMVVNHLKYEIIHDKIILVCDKYRHLLVYLMDGNCNVKSQYVNNVNDYKIKTLTKTNIGFFLGTVNCKVYKINVLLNEDKLDVSLSLIEMKDSYSSCELHSIAFSTNSVMCILGFTDRKMLCRKEPTKLDIVFCSTDNSSSGEVILLNNPTKKLTYYWDCIEYLRYKVMKQKCLPAIDYSKLYSEAETDIYKMKIYLIFTILYNNLDKTLRNGSIGVLPETSVELIREKIQALHCTDIIGKLYNSCKINGKLNDFEFERFVVTKKYLEYYCTKYKKQLSDFMNENTLKVLSMDFVTKIGNNVYICQCCDEVLDGLTCKNEHINMFCSISFTLIESDEYLICKNCNCTARTDLEKDELMCTFCDLYMSSCNIPD